MSRSVLLQLTRDSIQEVLEAKNTIDREDLIQTHPLLTQVIPTTVNLYIANELRGTNQQTNLPLVDAIIIGAKKAAFEDENFSPLKTSEYLSCEIELILHTQEGVMSQKDGAILDA